MISSFLLCLIPFRKTPNLVLKVEIFSSYLFMINFDVSNSKSSVLFFFNFFEALTINLRIWMILIKRKRLIGSKHHLLLALRNKKYEKEFTSLYYHLRIWLPPAFNKDFNSNFKGKIFDLRYLIMITSQLIANQV